MPKKYLELDSNYRNRNIPNSSPASFDIPISQSGTNSQYNALDPVTDAYPIMSFIPNEETVTGTIYTDGNTTGLNTSSTTKFLISIAVATVTASPNYKLLNYFAGAVIYSGTIFASRITEWIYISDVGGPPPTLSIFSVMVDTAVPATAINTAATAINISLMTKLLAAITVDDPLPPQQVFIPCAASIPNLYNGYYLLNQTAARVPKYTTISGFDKDTHMVVASANLDGWILGDVLVLRKTLPLLISGNYYGAMSAANPIVISGYNISHIQDAANVDIIASPAYINSFVRYYTTLSYTSAVTRIVGVVLTITTVAGGVQSNVVDSTGTAYTYYSTNKLYRAVAYTSYIATVAVIPNTSLFEILPYSRDNFSPFVYNGSLASQNQAVSYEVCLNSLTVPNAVLKTGGRIALYPYVYVEIENRGSASSNINTIYSNNPNTYKAIFKVPITDLNHPTTTPFVKLTGNGVVQTIPFKVNCDMSVAVKLPDGSLFATEDNDTSNGQAPNPMLQLSLLFEVNRI